MMSAADQPGRFASLPSFRWKREELHDSASRSSPLLHKVEMDSRLRGNDGVGRIFEVPR